jgi:hypothetical protein
VIARIGSPRFALVGTSGIGHHERVDGSHFSLALFPRQQRAADRLPELMQFANFDAADNERRKHPGCGFEIRDHDHDEKIVGQGY